GRVVVDVGAGPALSPQDAAQLAERVHGQRGATNDAVVVPSTRLTERPATSERVVPLDARARPTSPDLAVEYLFRPEGAAREFDPNPRGRATAAAPRQPEVGPRPTADPPAEASQQPTTDDLAAAYATVRGFETRRDKLVTARAEQSGGQESMDPAD